MRVVFDTNTVVSALIFSRGRLSWLRDHWQGGQVTPLASKETGDEIIRVLSYPKFKLEGSEVQCLLADYLPFAEIVVVDSSSTFPRCRDVDDQMFIDLAINGKAKVLVSGDNDLLEMEIDAEIDLAILTPAQYRKRASVR